MHNAKVFPSLVGSSCSKIKPSDPSMRPTIAASGLTVLDPAACGNCFGSSHSAIAGGLMKSTGTLSAGTGLWQDPNFAATNYSEFSGLPGGYRNYVGPFNQLGSVGYWWSSSSSSSFEAWSRRLEFNTGVAYRSNTFLPKNSGFSVRCIQD